MAEMSEMPMPLPENTLPMMAGEGPHGALEMGGMFTVLKVRDDLKPGDYADPGWYAAPAGTVAWLLADEAGIPEPQAAPAMPDSPTPALQVRKPGGHQH